MSIRILFNAQLNTLSQKGQFSLDTIAAGYVTNRDGCMYQYVPVSNKGLF